MLNVIKAKNRVSFADISQILSSYWAIKLKGKKKMTIYPLGQNFFISWFTNPPTVIFRKVGKK